MSNAADVPPDVPGVRRVSVHIEGALLKPRHWAGWVLASEDLVGMTLVSCGTHYSWAKAAGSGARLALRVQLGNYDDQHRDVQVAVEVAEAFTYGRCLLPSGFDHVQMEDLAGCTGGALHLATIPGQPAIHAWALLFARTDAKFGRNRTWHLRPELLDAIADPLRSALSRGRTGAFDLGSPP